MPFWPESPPNSSHSLEKDLGIISAAIERKKTSPGFHQSQKYLRSCAFSIHFIGVWNRLYVICECLGAGVTWTTNCCLWSRFSVSKPLNWNTQKNPRGKCCLKMQSGWADFSSSDSVPLLGRKQRQNIYIEFRKIENKKLESIQESGVTVPIRTDLKRKEKSNCVLVENTFLKFGMDRS